MARRKKSEESGGGISPAGWVVLIALGALGYAAVYLSEKYGPEFLTTPDEHGRTPLDKIKAAAGGLVGLGILGRVLLPRLIGGALFWPIGLALGIMAATGTLGWVVDALGLGGLGGGGGAGNGTGPGNAACPPGTLPTVHINPDGTVARRTCSPDFECTPADAAAGWCRPNSTSSSSKQTGPLGKPKKKTNLR